MTASHTSKKRKLESRNAHPDSNGWHEEQDYETRPRKAVKESRKLFLKANHQLIAQEDEVVSDAETDSFLGTEDDEDSDIDLLNGETTEEVAPEPSAKEQILQAKEELARLAALINEDPEENASSLKEFGLIYSSTANHVVKQLVLATQCAVYKDIIPGYRIRPMTEGEEKEKVSKDVKKLRNYEQNLVNGYKHYVKELENCIRNTHVAGLTSMAISCASTLLLAVPHFNFRTELITVVMSPLRRREGTKDWDKSIETLEKLFKDDDDGKPSLEVVSVLAKMMRARDYHIHESLLNLFLSLRILSEFMGKGSYDSVERGEGQIMKRKIRREEKKKFRSKRDKKLMRQRKEVENEFKEADAIVSHEQRDKMQAEMLKLVFATYFRILKAKIPNLMGAVLEGLAKHAHLINQDFFADILEALKDIIRDTEIQEDEELESESHSNRKRDGTRESLLCIVTAFALLHGQEGKSAVRNLHLDLDFFISFLYSTLFPTMLDADIEKSGKSLHLQTTDDDTPPKKQPNVNIKTKTVLLIRSLSSALLPPTAVSLVPPLRLAAFTKQLMTAALQLPEKSCQAVLGLLARVTQSHGRKVASLWSTEDRRGDGVFDALRGDVEGSNPFASTVWEGELLRIHYSSKVKEAIGIVEKNVKAVL